jgi:hypothetical protein
MKNRLAFILCCISILGFVLVLGCGNSSSKVDSISTPQSTTTDSLNTPTSESATPTQISTPTLTPAATLESTQAYLEIQRFTNQDVDCSIPCIWGIIPGKTTIGEATNIFTPLHYDFEKTTINNIEYYLNDRFSLSVEKGIVEYMELDYPYYDNYGKQLWPAFLPSSVLNRFGIPSKVSVYLDYPHEPGFVPGTVWYGMTLFYIEKHLVVDYNLALGQDGERVKACPNADVFSGVTVYFGKGAEDKMPVIVPLEKATSMSLQQFHDLLSKATKDACFFLNRAAFFQ